jgi:hypothetical protein
MKLTPKKYFYVMVLVLALCLVGAGAVVYFGNGLLTKQSSNVVDLKLENKELEEQLSAYQAAKASVEKYSYLTDIVEGALPQDKDQARSVREIQALAQASGISVKSIQFPASTLGQIAPPSSSGSATPAVGASTAITQAKPVTGLTGVYSIETVVTPNADNKNNKVSYSQLIDFLQSIESNRRAMQVSNLQISPLGQSATDSISFVLTLNIFIKP